MERLLAVFGRHQGVLIVAIIWLAIALAFPTTVADAGRADGSTPPRTAVATTVGQ